MENDPSHLEQIRKCGDINVWSIEIAKFVTFHLQKCLAFQTENPNLLIISYESLVDRKAETLDTVFGFLEQSRDASIIEDIVAQTSFERMKANASEPGFFRAGRKSTDNPEISTDTKAEVDRICGSVLARVGIALPRRHHRGLVVLSAGTVGEDALRAAVPLLCANIRSTSKI